MSISLHKNETMSITSYDNKINGVIVGLGWDCAECDGVLLTKANSAIDCDLSAIICGHDGKKIDVVYFNKKRSENDAIVYAGDNRSGVGEGDDEKIYINFTKIPQNVGKLVIIVNIYDAAAKHQHFGMIKNAFVRIVNWKTEEEICRYNLTENYNNMTGLIVGELVRSSGSWDFVPMGKGVVRASRITAITRMYE